MKSHRDQFENLFVLELANNHWGSLERGLRIVRDHGTVVRFNNVRAAIKLQLRDVDAFIHRDFKGNQEIRYIHKTEKTQLPREAYHRLVREIRAVSCIPMATPFDEASVAFCEELGLPMLKLASSDVNDWPLIERIAATRLPVIASSGGASEKDLDDLVSFFGKRNLPLALNHCVSVYPSEDHELELNQIEYLRGRYPHLVIGYSTHEYRSWDASMYMSYAKGARTWERHVDVEMDDVPVSAYCTLPHQADGWFKAFHKAREMSGGSGSSRRVCSRNEITYLDALVRGAYARRDLEAGYVFSRERFSKDFYLAIPLQKGQLSCREVMDGETLVRPIRADEPLGIGHIDGPYSANPSLRALIESRGV